MGFVVIAKSFYACTGGIQPLEWTETEKRAFKALKKALVSALAQAYPDITNLFHLYVDEA